MTEKTDIAALLDMRDLAERIKAAMASCVESFCMEVADSIENEIGRGLSEQEHQQISETASGLLVAQDQLEAERQRTCEMTEQYLDRNAALTSATLRYEKAEAELASIRGTQEPDHYRYSCGSCGYETLAYTSKCPTCNYHKIEEEPLFTHPPKPVVVLPEINDDLVEILGRPNFTCAGLAELFRRNGTDIKRKSENEQAFVLHWLMGVYLNHHDGWRVVAETELKAIADKVKAENAAGIVVKDGE